MRTWVAALFLLGSVPLSFGQVQLTVPNLNAVPGAQIIVPLMLSTGGSISALQFKVGYDPAVLGFSEEPSILRGDALVDHTVGSHHEAGLASVVVFSGSLNTLRTGPGTLIQLLLVASAGAPSNSSTQLTLSEIQASDAQGNSITVSGVNGTITFSAAANIPAEGENQLIFPQFANGEFQGGKFAGLMVLVNRTGASASGQVEFVKSDGTAFMVNLTDGRSDSQFSFDVPSGGSVFLSTDGLGGLAVGYAKVSATAPLGGALLFTMKDTVGKTLTEAGVGSSPAGRQFSIPVLYQPPGADTGIAFANPFGTDVEVDLTLKDESGATIGEPKTLNLAAGRHNPQFASQFFSILKQYNSFRGSIEVEANGKISVIALKQEGLLLTTFPAVQMEQ